MHASLRDAAGACSQLLGPATNSADGKAYLCAGSHCIAGNGCRLDITAESREEAGVRRLLQPETWSLQLCSPALAGDAAAADLPDRC
jgi:hypothetical protein